MDELFETCGYIASFFGTFIEGEIFLLTSVISSKLGYINFFGGLMAAFGGAFLRDSMQFFLAKKYGTKLLKYKPKLQTKLDSTSVWFEKRPFFYLTFYRLMYGFGTPILILSGLKDISIGRFVLHSAIGIGIWVSLLGGLGYFCADLMIENLNFISEHSIEFIVVLAIIGLLYWFFFKRPHRNYCFKPIEEKDS